MSTDIKALAEKMERAINAPTRRIINHDDILFLIAELRRLWAIEEAARKARKARRKA